MPQLKAYIVCNDIKTPLKYQQTTFGRLTSNLFPINDPTVSKNHAIINYLSKENKFYLTDLSTVNGTFINGNKIQANKKVAIKHKDAIQFGKHGSLFHFYQSQPEHEKKGKINLKDYCFELDSDEDMSYSQMQVSAKEKSKVQIKPQKQPSNLSPGPSNVSPGPSRQAKPIKIPNLADYLQLDGSLLSSNPSFQQAKKPEPDLKQSKGKESRFGRQTKVELAAINDSFDEQEIQKLRIQQERRRNVFLSQQAEKMAREEKTRALQQEKIRLQIQRHKQEQQMLKKQIELEQKIKQEQQKMANEKKRIEDDLLRRQQERRQRQRQAQEQQRQKERRFVQQLRQEKETQLQQIRDQQQLMRTKSQAAMKSQLEQRKKELESQAQALATQYEQIYRQTIRKMKNDIEKEENQIDEFQRNIETAKEQRADLQLKSKQVNQAVQYTQQQYDHVLGRNKAFILYASELQNRLDKLKEKRTMTEPKRVTLKIKEDIQSSRKLLSMKRGQLKALQDEISKIRLSLNMDKRMSSSDMMETILSNHEEIQRCKYIYFQYLREEKAMKDYWESSLQQNQHYEQQAISLYKDVQNHKKELLSNLRDNASRLTQQRIHMLRCLHYIPQEKKRAAKLLIEEMVSMQQEIRGMVADSEQTHDKINSLIVDSERLKLDNEYISQILFGADSTSHHFDNMKIQINELIERIQLQRDETRVNKRLKLAEQIEGNQLKIYESGKKLEKLNNRWRQGLRGQKVILAQRNPIIFFGDLLAKKQIELNGHQMRSSKLQRQYATIAVEIEQMQRKKSYLGQNLQTFKREELSKIRQNLLG